MAEVTIGSEIRQGAAIKNGYTESVAGIVQMIRGGNAREVVNRIKLKVAEINEGKLLPEGLQIVPFYDRTDLVNAAMFNVAKVLIEGVILVIILLFLFWWLFWAIFFCFWCIFHFLFWLFNFNLKRRR